MTTTTTTVRPAQEWRTDLGQRLTVVGVDDHFAYLQPTRGLTKRLAKQTAGAHLASLNEFAAWTLEKDA